MTNTFEEWICTQIGKLLGLESSEAAKDIANYLLQISNKNELESYVKVNFSSNVIYENFFLTIFLWILQRNENLKFSPFQWIDIFNTNIFKHLLNWKRLRLRMFDDWWWMIDDWWLFTLNDNTTHTKTQMNCRVYWVKQHKQMISLNSLWKEEKNKTHEVIHLQNDNQQFKHLKQLNWMNPMNKWMTMLTMKWMNLLWQKSISLTISHSHCLRLSSMRIDIICFVFLYFWRQKKQKKHQRRSPNIIAYNNPYKSTGPQIFVKIKKKRGISLSNQKQQHQLQRIPCFCQGIWIPSFD